MRLPGCRYHAVGDDSPQLPAFPMRAKAKLLYKHAKPYSLVLTVGIGSKTSSSFRHAHSHLVIQVLLFQCHFWGEAC